MYAYPARKLKLAVPSEDQEQIVAATWLRKNNILFYHIPNGGKRSLSEGAKFKAMGLQAGVPDICVPMARRGYHGLYIELKRKWHSVVSEKQQFWLEALAKEGYCTHVAYGSEDLIRLVKQYLGMEA